MKVRKRLMGIGIRINNFSIGSQAIANNNPTWTERFEIFEDDNNDSRLAVATATPTSVSSSGNYSAVISSAAESFGALVVVNDSVSDSISIDAPGILTLSGNSHTLNYGRQIPIDAPGVLTLSTPEPTTDTQENELWVNDTKPSNTWTNQTK